MRLSLLLELATLAHVYVDLRDGFHVTAWRRCLMLGGTLGLN